MLSVLTCALGALVAGLGAWALTGFMVRNAESDARILRSHLQVPVAAVLGGLAGMAGSWAEMLAFVVLAVASGLLTVIDLAEERLPDAIVLPLIPVTLVLLTLAAAVTGEWWSLLRAVEAGAALFAFVFLMMIFSPDLGFGDVKLAAITGAFCGWFGWGAVLLGFAAAWMTFGVLGVVLLATRKRHGRSSFAFGPFLIFGAVLGVFWAGCVLPW
ncbi:MAG TPA: A24 family peptidase [Propionicimonas sp.]|jgi:leader peptidase (prepilin peptidase)/N-methyltransferase|uniref:A24 family peptidase n=1 Tax=Propionicimonas sp. TaxID=1955623 RepID=UPI002F400092